MLPDSLKNQTVLILGAGLTGLSAASFLLGKTKEVLLSESKPEPEKQKDKIKLLKKQGVEFEFNQNSDTFIEKADLVVISPGINPQTDIVQKLNKKNIPVISDIELGSYFIDKPIIGVTGTNGKTTTTSLITHLINTNGKKAIACGNIGKPFLEIISDNHQADYYVIEISSFQAYYSPNLACDIAICLNITPDHLDWHGNLENYIKAKEKLFVQQKFSSWSVLNYGDDIVKNFSPNNHKFYFSYKKPDQDVFNSLEHCAFYENNKLRVKKKDKVQEIIDKSKLQILGPHNIENMLASISVAEIINIKDKDGLESFKGVEHRLEYIKNTQNKTFFNDSKATNPEATIKAIEAVSEENNKNITLILGGKDKNTSLDKIITAIKEHISEVILYGEAKQRFSDELNKSNYKNLIIVDNLHEAVQTSLKSKTNVVLFSPACSSFDMFKNYEERGKTFKELVSKL